MASLQLSSTLQERGSSYYALVYCLNWFPWAMRFFFLKALYGARHASKGWQNCYTGVIWENRWFCSRALAVCFYGPASRSAEGATLLAPGDDGLLERSEETHDEVDAPLKQDMSDKVLHRLGPGKREKASSRGGR